MGMAISDITTADVLYQLNNRFAPGDALKEMVAIQKEFEVFSERYSLSQTFRVLHIVPADFKERRLWFLFLDGLRQYKSNHNNDNGHDGIRNAYQQNLESDTPLPVFMTTHRAEQENMVVLINIGQPIIYETQDYLTISIPIIPVSLSERAERRRRAKEDLKAKS